MILQMVTYDDGDYYCEGTHLVGVFSSRELADTAVDAHIQSHKDKRIWTDRYRYDVYTYEVDKVYT